MQKERLVLQCPVCCCAQFQCREDLLVHLVEVSTLLKNLQCTLCHKRFLTLQDLIEHLKYDCTDQRNELNVNENHITYIDCSDLCAPSSTDAVQTGDSEKHQTIYVKINVENNEQSVLDDDEIIATNTTFVSIENVRSINVDEFLEEMQDDDDTQKLVETKKKNSLKIGLNKIKECVLASEEFGVKEISSKDIAPVQCHKSSPAHTADEDDSSMDILKSELEVTEFSDESPPHEMDDDYVTDMDDETVETTRSISPAVTKEVDLVDHSKVDKEVTVVSTRKPPKKITPKKRKLPAKILPPPPEVVTSYVPVVIYPIPKEADDDAEVSEKDDHEDEVEMLMGTEEEALQAGCDPSELLYKCTHCVSLFKNKEKYDMHKCLKVCDICGGMVKTHKLLRIHMKHHAVQEDAEMSVESTNISEDSSQPKEVKSEGKETEREIGQTADVDMKSSEVPPVKKVKHSNKKRRKAYKTFHCDQCNADFCVTFQEIHDKIHAADTNIYECEPCSKSFETMKNLYIHIRMHGSWKFACTLCTAKFRKESALEKHLCIHNGTKPYKCRHCGKTFRQSGDRSKHERVHTGEKPNVCEICGRAFRVSYSLRLHMRSHTNERPYSCNICGKSFKGYSTLSFHLRSHGDERPYKCTICEKSFKTQNALYGHTNHHKKPFKCGLCERVFSTRIAVVKHQQEIHAIDPYKDRFDCVVCGAMYGRAWSLEMHLKTHGKLGSSGDSNVLKKMVEMGSIIGEKPPNPIVKEPKGPKRIRKKKEKNVL